MSNESKINFLVQNLNNKNYKEVYSAYKTTNSSIKEKDLILRTFLQNNHKNEELLNLILSTYEFDYINIEEKTKLKRKGVMIFSLLNKIKL